MIDKIKTNLNSFDIRKQENKILYVFIASLLLYAAFVLFADLKKITTVALSFHWGMLPLLLILTIGNYFFRALRFQYYLKEIGIKLRFTQAFSIFMSGLSMTVTPGKSGEIIKAYLLRRTEGNKLSEIVPLLIIERLTDGIAMIILAIAGLFLVKSSQLFFICAIIFVIGGIIFFQIETYILKILSRLEAWFPRFKFLEFFSVFFRNAKTLLSPKNLTIGVGIGIIAWACEGVALYYLVQNFAHTDVLRALALCLFIFSFSSIAGFFVFIPGGIGVAEGSITYFLTQLFLFDIPTAIFITILFRFVTLWFGVSLGLSFLIRYIRTHFKT